MTAIVTKGKGLWSIARENHVKVSDLYKANPGLESMQKKGIIPKNHKIKIPTKSKGSSPKLKPKPKSTSKKTVKKSTKKKTSKKVSKEANSTGKCKCVSAPWMTAALKEAKLVRGRKQWSISSKIKKYFKYSRPNSSYGAETSWCMAFVCWTLKEGNLSIERKFIGSQWLRFKEGQTKKVSTPFYGAIAIWQDVRKVRGKWIPTKGGNGHVSMLYGRLKNGKYVFLGGNQGKTIKLTAYDTSGNVFTAYGSTKRRFVGFYQPIEYVVKECDKIKKVKSLSSENKKVTGKAIKTVKNERT